MNMWPLALYDSFAMGVSLGVAKSSLKRQAVSYNLKEDNN